jgi:hypothetical protein
MVKNQNPSTENRPMNNQTRNQGHQENFRKNAERLSYCRVKTVQDEK